MPGPRSSRPFDFGFDDGGGFVSRQTLAHAQQAAAATGRLLTKHFHSPCQVLHLKEVFCSGIAANHASKSLI
jgi:hypothetical protein